MSSLLEMIKAGKSQKSIGAFLDGLSHEDRLKEINSVGGKFQSCLFQIATPDLKFSDLMPSDAKPLQEVIFYGKNSLPLFSTFQKRMALSGSGDGSKVWGYNFQTFQKITGPGCFVIDEATDRPGEIMVDYTRLPKENVAGWPEIKSNETGLTKLVYGYMKDYLRRVSKNVFIGEATKKGKSIGQYFILCRQ
ncbi:MAG: hypothetical protein IPJ69_09155 [Deltaproteobacteria bacterium]|nr:MAG: hypothetical protein IPJ69_09155 [Deltaproteobacteria bacterium]